jgi:hypothetical protein
MELWIFHLPAQLLLPLSVERAHSWARMVKCEIEGSLGGDVGLDMVATFRVMKEALQSNVTDETF